MPRRAEKALVVKNGSKMRGRFSGEMPHPTSRTQDADIRGRRRRGQHQARGQLIDPPRRQDHLLASGHGFRGVEDEVQEDLLDEVLGAGCFGEGRGAVERDAHLAQEPVAEQREGVFQDAIQITRARRLGGFAAEAEHGFDNAGALLDDGGDAVHARAHLAGVVEAVLNDL